MRNWWKKNKTSSRVTCTLQYNHTNMVMHQLRLFLVSSFLYLHATDVPHGIPLTLPRILPGYLERCGPFVFQGSYGIFKDNKVQCKIKFLLHFRHSKQQKQINLNVDNVTRFALNSLWLLKPKVVSATKTAKLAAHKMHKWPRLKYAWVVWDWHWEVSIRMGLKARHYIFIQQGARKWHCNGCYVCITRIVTPPWTS